MGLVGIPAGWAASSGNAALIATFLHSGSILQRRITVYGSNGTTSFLRV